MKFWIKIVVAFSVVVVLGFGVWAFFFREKDDVVAYNEVCELIDYKDSLNLKDKINELKKRNYISENNEEKNTTRIPLDDSTDVKKKILSIRDITLSEDTITYYDNGGNLTCVFDSYIVVESISDDIIKYLLPYLKHTNASDAELSNLRKKVGEYIEDLKSLDECLDILENCQISIEGTEIEYEVLLGNYNSFYKKYRKTLNDSGNVINLMISNIRSNAGQFKCDTEFALMDSFARSLIVSSSVEEKLESSYAYDLHYIIEKYNRHNAGDNIYDGEYSEFEFLTSYNELINKYSSVLNKVYQKHNLEKKKIADGENLSDIVQESQDSVIAVLNVLGF